MLDAVSLCAGHEQHDAPEQLNRDGDLRSSPSVRAPRQPSGREPATARGVAKEWRRAKRMRLYVPGRPARHVHEHLLVAVEHPIQRILVGSFQSPAAVSTARRVSSPSRSWPPFSRRTRCREASGHRRLVPEGLRRFLDCACGHDRRPARHRLELRQPEAFVRARRSKHPRTPVEIGELRVR